MINYEELIKCLHEINEQINELKEDGITDNIKLLKHARFTHKNINDEIGHLSGLKRILDDSSGDHGYILSKDEMQ